MISIETAPRSGRLFIKYLLIALPIFTLFSALSLAYIAELNAERAEAELTARIGERVAGMSLVIDGHRNSQDGLAARDLLNTLLADRAIDCAEVTPGKRLKAPEGLGCRGFPESREFVIPIMGATGGKLTVRYNLDEVDAVRLKQREFTIAALMAGLVIAILSCFVGFHWIVGKPLKLLIGAMQESSQTGKMVRVAHKQKDELGYVIQTYNQMQDKLEDATQELEAKVEERTRELVELQAKLLQQERLATFGKLTATVSHEIRNPLAAIRNSLFAIRRQSGEENERVHKALDRAERSVGRCDNIIGDLLEFTRSHAVEPEPTVLANYLDTVLSEIAFPREVSVERKFATGLPKIDLDPTLFRRVIFNLVENAIEAIGERGDGKGVVTIAIGQNGRDCELSVTDDGPGIKDDVLQNIFEPLFSTKSFGAGLGLATVKSLVEAHGASLHVETVRGRGTTFSVRFPMECRSSRSRADVERAA